MDVELLRSLLQDPCGMLAIGVVMYVAGDRASAGRNLARHVGAAVAGVTLIGVMAFGIRSEINLFALAIGASGVGLFVLGTAWIVFTITFGGVDALIAAMTPEPRRPEPIVIYVPPPEIPMPKPLPALPPPPPSPEERTAAAKRRYENTLRLLSDAGLNELELKAAQESAKQQYLQDIDEAMA